MSTERVLIFDTTLRDGDQCPGALLNLPQKVKIAQALENAGVDIIEAGFAGSSEQDFRAVQSVCQATSRAVICSLSRCIEKDIQASAAALAPALAQGRGRIHVFCATSDVHVKDKLKKSEEQIIAMIAKNVAYAKTFTSDVQFSTEDAVRTNTSFLISCVQTAIDAGATTINLPDTVGCSTPQEYGRLIHQVIQGVGFPAHVVFSNHCHNDMGMATANALAGILGGARQIEGCVNGIGERAGNMDWMQACMAIHKRPDIYPYQTQIDLTQAMPLSKLVETDTAIPVAYTHPLVGRNVFWHASGVHQDGVIKNPSTYEYINPQEVGGTSKIVLNRLSGLSAVYHVLNSNKDALRQHGVSVDDVDVNATFERIKSSSEKLIIDGAIVPFLTLQHQPSLA